MEESYFVNKAVTKCFIDYFNNESTSFYAFIIEALCDIFDKLDIENSYKLNLEYNACGFMFILKKYGSSETKVENFVNHLEKYYDIENNSHKIVASKNPYFTVVLKDLIDFYFKKCQELKLSLEEIKNFYDNLYCMHSKSAYKRSYVFLKTEYPEEIDRYFKTKLYEYNNKLTFLPIKENVLNMEVYEKFGLDKNKIDLVNQETLDEINNKVFEYLHIDVNNEDKVFLANKFMKDMNGANFKLSETSGKINVKAFLIIFGSIIILGIIIGIMLVR